MLKLAELKVEDLENDDDILLSKLEFESFKLYENKID